MENSATGKVHFIGEKMEPMRCISIRQPFAWLVAIGIKDVENKERSTRFRGRILIHTGQNRDFLDKFLEDNSNQNFEPDWFPLGAIIGAADLVDCQEMNETLEGNVWSGGPKCYIFRNPHWFQKPIPCKGQVTLFPVPNEISGRVTDQLSMPGRRRDEINPAGCSRFSIDNYAAKRTLLSRGMAQLPRFGLA